MSKWVELSWVLYFVKLNVVAGLDILEKLDVLGELHAILAQDVAV